MRSKTSTRIPYRGFNIAIQVDRAGDQIFGHADLFADDEFKARLAVGTQGRRTKEVRDRLRRLAKSKVDVWAITGSARSAAAPGDARPSPG